MALNPFPPVPNTRLIDDPARDSVWRRWLEQFFNRVNPLTNVHNDLSGLQGGTTAQYYHLTQAQHSTVTSFGTFTNNRVLVTGPTSSITTNDALQYLITSSTLTATNISSVTILSSSTATLPLVNIDGGNIDSTAIGANMASTGVFTNVSTATLFSSGNVSLGGASSNSLTISSGTWVIGNDYIATRAAGTVANATVINADILTNFTGNSSGASVVVAERHFLTAQGANPISQTQAMQFRMSHSGTSTLTTAIGVLGSVTLDGTGNVGTVRSLQGNLSINSTGSATTVDVFFSGTPNTPGTGTIVNLNGFRAANLGNATLITNSVGFQADNFTASATLTASFRSAQNSATGAWGYLHTGTANNAFNGNVRIGSTVAPTVALDVTGSQILSGGIAIATRSVVSSYAAVVDDFTILANASGTAFTVTLPHASTFPNKIYTVKKIDSTGNAVTVSSVSNIDGATTTSLAAQFNKIMLQSNTTQWYEI